VQPDRLSVREQACGHVRGAAVIHHRALGPTAARILLCELRGNLAHAIRMQ